uniref:Neurturin n=1 Tax=Scleropages formosus TaxID=113540 RepID=A0A8C9TW68_SCLFO
MRLWKWSAAALALCGTVLLDVLTRSAVPTGPRLPRSWPLCRPLVSAVSSVFQSFTEGELQHVIAALVDRKAARDAQRDPQGRRTRRARGEGRGSCSLREAVVSVTELGLGYDSDETLLFRYCSGRCAARRRNYDVSLEHMKRAGLLKGGRRNKVRRGPCCRPIAYDDDVSFLDNNHRYYTIHEVSARACACV